MRSVVLFGGCEEGEEEEWTTQTGVSCTQHNLEKRM